MRRSLAIVPRLAQAAAWQQQQASWASQARAAAARSPTAALFVAAATGSGAGVAAWALAVSSAAPPHAARGFATAAPLAKGLVQLRYLLGLGGLAVAAQFDAVTDSVKLTALAAVRLSRDVATAAAIVADYKVSLAAAPPDGPERKAVLAECHERGADRLLALCFANGGIYTKLGQHIGQLDHLLPSQYVHKMRDNLLDKCPISDAAEVAAIIREDLGAPPEALFDSFDPVPIASASLAQVHVAKGRDGRKLAIKVQHAGLRESCRADVGTIEMLVHAARIVFPDFNYQWLVDEIKENLPKELDFRHEAANAERCRANLASTKSRLGGRVAVPAIDHNLTSTRVLTMEFIDGARLTDPAALSDMGVDRRALAALVAEVFNEMVFIHGDVHCDPHAANLLVRKDSRGRDQLVLLDHGLYRIIDDEFRWRYAALWRALVFGDAPGIKEHAGAMNAGEMYPLFAAMLTQRPWDQIVDRRIDHLSVPKSSEEREKLQGYAQQYVREIGDLLLRMPRPLLLLLKTNDCLRSVDNILGSPLNTLVMTARECTRAIADIRSARQPGLRSWAAGTWDALHVEAVVAFMRIASFWASLRRSLAWGGGGSSGKKSGGGWGGLSRQLREDREARERAAAAAGGNGEEGLLGELPAEFVAASGGSKA